MKQFHVAVIRTSCGESAMNVSAAFDMRVDATPDEVQRTAEAIAGDLDGELLSVHPMTPVTTVDARPRDFDADDREAFETWYLREFIAARERGGVIIDDNGCPATREALFWKDDRGEYGITSIRYAFIGFLAGRRSRDER